MYGYGHSFEATNVVLLLSRKFEFKFQCDANEKKPIERRKWQKESEPDTLGFGANDIVQIVIEREWRKQCATEKLSLELGFFFF